jgi:hypothetical protein
MHNAHIDNNTRTGAGMRRISAHELEAFITLEIEEAELPEGEYGSWGHAHRLDFSGVTERVRPARHFDDGSSKRPRNPRK